jgi:WD40 repeat protein
MVAAASLVLAVAPAQAATPAGVTVKRVKTFDQFRVVSVAPGPAGVIAFGLEDNTVKVFDAAKLMSTATLGGHPQPVYALAFNKAGTQLLTADVTARIYLWDVKTGKRIKEFAREKGHTRSIKSIAFSPDGIHFATIGDDDFLKIWSVKGANPVANVPGAGSNLYGVGFTPSGSVITGTLTSELRIYKVNGELVAKMAVPNSNGVNGLATSWGGHTVTASRDGRLTVWDVAKRTRVKAFLGHSDWAIDAAVTPNGAVAASSSSDGTVSIWNVKSGASVAKLENQSYAGSPITFTTDGKFFVTGNNSGFLEVYAVNPPQAAAPAAPAPRKRRR